MAPANTGEYIVEATKAAPPVAVTGMTLMGTSLSEWVMLATLVYTVVQLVWFVYDKATKHGR